MSKIFGPTRSVLLGATALVWCFTTPAVAQQASEPGAAAVDDGDSAAIEEVIVTAQRRRERIQDVPIAITAFSAERLDQQGINDAQDLQGTVPSLVVNSVGQQNRDVQSITLRGQGASYQASPGVVVYLNETPLPSPSRRSLQGGPGNFLDLENVQVLAGPQGTLFGRNTTGGALLLVPKKPSDDLGGWLQARTGNYSRMEVEGAVNVPLIADKLAIRAAGAFHDREGFTNDIVWNKDRDDEHWYSGRLGILATPSDKLENYTMLYAAKSDNNGAGVVNEGFNIPGLTAFGLCDDAPGGAVSCDVYRNAPTPNNKRQTAPGEDVFSTLETWGVTNTTDYRITDNLKVRNIASYHKLKSRYTFDLDGTVIQHDNDGALRQPAPGQVTIPGVGPIIYDNAIADDGLPNLNVKLVTEELQLQGDALGGRLQYTVGGFYSKQEPGGPVGESGRVTNCPADYTGQSFVCPVTFGSPSSVEQTSKALYAQATLDLGAISQALDGVRLTGGYRETWDETTGTSAASPPVTLKDSAPSWLIGVDYRVLPQVLLFAKVNRGYKSGGYNASAVRPSTLTFGPETVTNYEAGFKADLTIADRPVRLNASYYSMDYRGIQRATADYAFPQIPGFPAGGAQIVNAEARVQGIETEVSVRPVRGVELGGNFSWTDGEYKNYAFPLSLPAVDCTGFKDPFTDPGVIGDFSCNAFSGVAEYVWSIHASVDHELPGDLGTLAFFVSYSHSSDIPTLGLGIEALEPLSRLEAFGLVNASLDWNNVANRGFDVGLFVTNLTDELYRVSYNNLYSNFGNYGASLYGEPRMYGVKVRRKFGGG